MPSSNNRLVAGDVQFSSMLQRPAPGQLRVGTLDHRPDQPLNRSLTDDEGMGNARSMIGWFCRAHVMTHNCTERDLELAFRQSDEYRARQNNGNTGDITVPRGARPRR